MENSFFYYFSAMIRNLRKYFFRTLAVAFALPYGCQNIEKPTLFTLLPTDKTGLIFNNEIIENDSINIITLEYIYNGGSVAVADFNNDGLTDIFFGGNIVQNKLFINKGDLVFKDVSNESNINDSKKWRSGVAVVDINNDGLLDIYQCATISKDSSMRANILYVNKGLTKEGVPYFEDQAEKYGIADTGHSSNAAFFDYDNDGDLDLYVLTNTIDVNVPTTYRAKIIDGSAMNTDRLYRNNNNGSFTNVSREAGINIEGYGLGLAIADINQDGWDDIYVSNDYITNDILYINNKDGTFTNKIDNFIKHQSQFSMGNCIQDVNNDGLLDIMTLDMLPEGNLRRKTIIAGGNYITYINNEQLNYANQHVRNMLQLNNGNGTFSEVGQMMGLYQTEWSWSPLFADFDNDGYKDLVVTNGFPKDITDRDFSNFRNGTAGSVATPLFLTDSIPVVKIPNRAFKNLNGLSFVDVNESWGMSTPSFSSGAAYADFDNDGDLDYVVSNINDNAFLYKNNLRQIDKHSTDTTHYLRIKLLGKDGNKSGYGAKVTVRCEDGTIYYTEHSIYRGYISCVEDFIHIGLGKSKKVNSLLVRWKDNTTQLITNIKSDQVLLIDQRNARKDENELSSFSTYPKSVPFVEDVSNLNGVPKFKHTEKDIIDYNIQRTLPHKFSQLGPAVAVGDVDGNGWEDLLIGGSNNYQMSLYKQTSSGDFHLDPNAFSSVLNKADDEGLNLFDADSDGDLDIYVAVGGFENKPEHSNYQDKLYVNNGVGHFVIDTLALPKMTTNNSCVRAADYDGDGDLDLFIGARVIPGRYPFSSESFLLENTKGKFTNVTSLKAPELINGGMITDALWTDFNNDHQIDLIVVGEFMAVEFYKNEGGRFSKIKNSGVGQFTGWWNSIVGGDFDQDGDTDYMVGNLGLNNYYNASQSQPLRVYANDYDKNGSVDALLTCYFKSEVGAMKEYPVHFWDELNSQSPKFRRKFKNYHEYGNASIGDLLTEEDLKESLVLQANYMNTSYLKNNGNKGFELISLSQMVQVAPVNGMLVEDFNGDTFLDVLMVGNDYGNEIFSGRHDAFTGLLVLGNGKGNFDVIPSAKSGFKVDLDAKALVKLTSPGGDLFIATQNRDSIRVFKQASSSNESEIRPAPLDSWAELIFTDGHKQKVEFYYGSGYLSQSTRRTRVPKNVKEIIIYDSKGKSRKIVPNGA